MMINWYLLTNIGQASAIDCFMPLGDMPWMLFNTFAIRWVSHKSMYNRRYDIIVKTFMSFLFWLIFFSLFPLLKNIANFIFRLSV